MASLLFLAFVYFAVGQAAATRNGGQSAADAAALAAAQDAREQLRAGWIDAILSQDAWDDYLNGEEYAPHLACEAAARFAAKNGAELWDEGCVSRRTGGEAEFQVRVRTIHTVGRSVLPGTEKQHAVASATAVLEPRCSFDPPVPPPTSSSAPPPPTGTPSPEPTPTPSPEPAPITGLVCSGVTWTIDPEDPRLPEAADLFTVRLVD
ncbi:hypothetical protein [Streptomyces roseoviridis]|uniref:Flp pilus-assembly TadG-like N-terminal domain-containing protein n=1 Tax=Streptomyces roseoviridis TaxID=67361 RepID=A0ABV5QRP8_9ACTN